MMKIDGLNKLRSWVVGALAVATTTVIAVPAHAAQGRDADNLAGYEHRGNAASTAVNKSARALVKLLRSPGIEKVLSYVRDAGKKDIARVIQKHASTIANTVDAIAELYYLTVALIRDNVMKALVAAGVSRETARITGFWIEQVLAWVP